MHDFKCDILKGVETNKKNPNCLSRCETLQLGLICSFHPHYHTNIGKRDNSETFVSILPSKRRNAPQELTAFMTLT